MTEQKTESPLVIAAKEKFSEVRTALEVVRASFGEIKIKGPDDAEGYKAAKEVAKQAGLIRRNIDARKKELKENVLREGQAYDSIARELQAIINPIEEAAKKEVADIDDFKMKEKLKVERAALLPERKAKLEKYEHSFTDDDLLLMGDVDFLTKLSGFQQAEIEKQNKAIEENDKRQQEADAEKKRLADLAEVGEKAAQAERERIANETAETERKRKEQEDKDRREKILPARRKVLVKIIQDYLPEKDAEKETDFVNDKILAMDEAEFSEFAAQCLVKAQDERRYIDQKKSEREKLNDWITAMLNVEPPKFSEGSLLQGEFDTIVLYLNRAVKA